MPGRKQSPPSTGRNYFRRNNGAEATNRFSKGSLATFPGYKPPQFPSRLPLYLSSIQLSISTSYSRAPFFFNPISAADCIRSARRESSKWKDERSSLTPFSPRLDLLQSGPCPKVRNKHGPFFKQQIQLHPPKQDVCR